MQVVWAPLRMCFVDMLCSTTCIACRIMQLRIGAAFSTARVSTDGSEWWVHAGELVEKEIKFDRKN